MKTAVNNINTGRILDDHFRKNKVNRTKLASIINRTGQSITKYENNSSIQTCVLLEICYALKHNFFQDMANMMPVDFTIDAELNAGGLKLITQLQEENKVLKIQNELLMRIKG